MGTNLELKLGGCLYSVHIKLSLPDIISQFFAFANKFCYEGLKPTYDNRVTTMVLALDDA
ncbi:hypothetical protein Zm00014a_027443 [Zea mays]|uniref:Uncharacterized protein n=1 Tax=Zea mays TaxID=4577 RepID=A0A3L6DN89_MAIZE|nr:hypothetical protein Zm00014a_027443 [Zea mays]